MFEKYKATKKDFEAIEEGIKTVWHPKLNFVFKNKKFIEKVIIVSYDCENFYLWSRTKFPKLTPIKCSLKQYFAYKIPHKLKILDDYQYWWRAGLEPRRLTKLLFPKLRINENTTSFISGGLLMPFIALQKKIREDSAYTTRESFLATIVHEFGHTYYSQHNLDLDGCLGKKDERLKLLKTALELYLHKTIMGQKPLVIYLPHPLNFSEVFAFCTEYTASNIFFTKHIQAINKFNTKWIKILIKKEVKAVPDRARNKATISFIEGDTAHATATVFGKIILHCYPKDWPQKLLRYCYL